MDIRRLVIDSPFANKSIISYGLIVYAKDTNRWAITQRKHSIEFLLYVKGSYRLTHLPFLLCNITQTESRQLLKCIIGEENFKTLYYSLGFHHLGFILSFQKFQETKAILPELLSNLNLTENKLQWTWPKGRLDISDITILDCAKREFQEEVEIELPDPIFISSSYMVDTIKTIARRNVESRYWIYIIPNEIPMKSPKDNPEVSNRLWGDAEFCQSVIQNKTLFDIAKTLVLNNV